MLLSITIKDYLDLAGILAICVTTIIAIWGLNSWRREIKWRRKYELAEEVLALFYQVEESFSQIRNTFSNLEEGSSRVKSAKEKPEETAFLNRANIVYERYQNESDVFIQLRKIKHRFKTVFGTNTEIPFNEIQKIINEIFRANHRLAQKYWRNYIPLFYSESIDEFIQKKEEYESIIWASYDEDDLIEARIKSIITDIEKICYEIIKPRKFCNKFKINYSKYITFLKRFRKN